MPTEWYLARANDPGLNGPRPFDADASRMIVARDVWNTPRTGDNPDLFAVLNAHATMLRRTSHGP